MPVVSIVVTTRNEADNIERCLESVRAQSLQDHEIIVVDNNSTDATKELARRYTPHVFDHGPERSSQRNFGVSRASGEYVFYLDADMILEPGVLAECVTICQRDSGIVGVYVPERIVGTGFWIKVRDFERGFYDGTVVDAVRFLPKRVFDEVGGFDTELCGPEDWDFDRKVRGRGRVVVCQTPLLHNEGDFNLARYLGKKSYYAGSFAAYVDRWGRDDPDVRRQLGPWYRYVGVFVERGRFLRLLRHPLLTIGMYYLRFRVGLSYLQVKLGRMAA